MGTQRSVQLTIHGKASEEMTFEWESREEEEEGLFGQNEPHMNSERSEIA